MCQANIEILTAEAERLMLKNDGIPTTSACLLFGAADVILRMQKEIDRMSNLIQQHQEGNACLREQKNACNGIAKRALELIRDILNSKTAAIDGPHWERGQELLGLFEKLV